jgi:hypothetical protein
MQSSSKTVSGLKRQAEIFIRNNKERYEKEGEAFDITVRNIMSEVVSKITGSDKDINSETGLAELNVALKSAANSKAAFSINGTNKKASEK